MMVRLDYYKKEDEAKDNSCKVKIVKQRNGMTGVTYLEWVGETTSFRVKEKKWDQWMNK